MESTTLSDDRNWKEQRLEARKPFLFVVLQADQPLSTSCRHALENVDEVHLRRGTTRTAIRRREDGCRRLVLTIPDRWMSTQHACLRRTPEGWRLEDTGSKNGTWLDGERIQAEILQDDAIFEVGHTFLAFRTFLTASDDDEPDVSEATLTPPVPSLSTFSPPLCATFSRLKDVAQSGLPVLIGGETGTGKEVAARAVHEISGRSGPFVAVNCGALPNSLVESELFGFRKGSFSGALEDRLGLVRSADGGTLFLDEIGDLTAPAQAALLRVVQEREVLSIGTVKPIPVNVRFVSATHRKLTEDERQGTFRSDLLARLSAFRVDLPPLRERREDLGILIRRILEKTDSAPETVSFSADAARALMTHEWPRNVRELEHRLSLAVVLAKGQTIQLEHVFDPKTDPAALDSDPDQDEPTAGGSARLTDEDIARRDLLTTLLRQHRGNITAVARAMGKARMQIHRWMKRYGIDRDELVR